jgi:hypothetical protein
MSLAAMLGKRDSNWQQVACAGPDEADVDIPVTPEVHLALRGRAADNLCAPDSNCPHRTRRSCAPGPLSDRSRSFRRFVMPSHK